MMQLALFTDDSPLAARQPKTDRLILARFLKDAGEDQRLDNDHIERAHAILVRWADFEKIGRLAELTETQLQGDFLRDVFGEALGYIRAAENEPVWHLEQHLAQHGHTPDAVLGRFEQGKPKTPLAVVELKGSDVHLDRDRRNGRTAVDQCWDYLVDTPPDCRWGIVSNIISIRLYERNSTKRVYEHFTLQSLRDIREFRQFYALFHRKGLIEWTAGVAPTAERLLDETRNRQREVGDRLYEDYSVNRTNLIRYLHFELGYPVDKSIEMAQRLFDRVMFIAFCEDRKLLPEKTIPKAFSVAGFHDVTNPRWQNFKKLFRFINVGNEPNDIPKYNGGLFDKHEVDDLELPDEPWTNLFHSISTYGFADEVNLDVLGHLFERSITELEKLKIGGLFGDAEKAERFATMPQSAKRKQLGIYYTPQELTSLIVQYTVGELIDERFAALAVKFGISKKDARRRIMPDDESFWRGCLDILRNLKIVDPACGSGAFLFQAYNVLEHRYLEVIGHLDKAGASDADELAEQAPLFILNDNLYGVDLSPEAVEITQLALWIRSATPGQTLATLSRNIVHGNSLVHDSAAHPAGFNWHARFPEVFQRAGASSPPAEPGFDCVIGNPPWERIKLQEREFFSLPAPEIATATNAATRRKLVAKLESDDPALYERYQEALAAADSLLTYCRSSDDYPLTGKGDINTYAVFAELAYQLVAPHGRVGLLVPSGIAIHNTTKDFFAALAVGERLIKLFDFDNREGTFFPEVHPDTQFSIINFCGSGVRHEQPDFIFGVLNTSELEDKKRHVILTGDDIKLLNPNSGTCPIFRTDRDAEITKAIYRCVPILNDHNRTGPTGNPWGISFQRMFDQTNDAELFHEAAALSTNGFKLKGNRWVKGKQTYLPLYEAKMFQAYDHRFGTIFVDTSNWINQGQTNQTTPVQHSNSEFLVLPRFWTRLTEIESRAPSSPAQLAFRDITNPTNRRTMLSGFAPAVGFINTLPIIIFPSTVALRRRTCLQANFGSFAFDYVARNKLQGRHMNFYILEQLPVFSPDTYEKLCPWSRKKTTLETWISERVLKLTCTAEDMLPLAEACDFKGGSFKQEYGGRLNKWDEAERAQLMAELDAAYFLLYGISRDDAEYILSTFKGIHTRNPLLPDSSSTADHILATHDKFSST